MRFRIWILFAFMAAGCAAQSDRLRHERRPEPTPRRTRTFVLSDSLPAGAPLLRSTLLLELDALLTEAERDSLASLPEGPAPREWAEAFWADRDPTPTTPRNERREEHYRRLRHALAEYPLSELPFYDTRGRDYVLFGPPDFTSEADAYVGVFYHPRRIVWAWTELEMLAEFWDFTSDGHFSPAGVDVKGRNLETTFGSFALSSGTIPSAALPVRGERILSWRGRHDLAVSERLDHYVRRAEGPPIEFEHDCYRFRGTADSLRLAVACRLSTAELDWGPGRGVRERGAWVEERSLFTRLEDGRGWRHEANYRFRSPRAALRHGDGILGLRFERSLPPGKYRVDVSLHDRIGGGEGMAFSGLRLAPVPPDSLALSDLMPVEAMRQAPPGEGFGGSGWILDPAVTAARGPGRPLTVYFEIYGLRLDENGANHYRVSYGIEPVRRERSVGFFSTGESSPARSVRESFVNRETGESAAHPLGIDVSQIEPAAYRLRVEVEDLIGGRRSSGSLRFEVGD